MTLRQAKFLIGRYYRVKDNSFYLGYAEGEIARITGISITGDGDDSIVMVDYPDDDTSASNLTLEQVDALLDIPEQDQSNLGKLR